MDLKIKQKIILLSYDIRYECEDIQMNSDDEYTFDLCGLCAIGAIKLHKKLEENGIKTEIKISKYHCFLMYEKYVIDITATQYGFNEKVLIMPLSKLLKNSFYRESYNFKFSTKSRREARKFLIKEKWNKSQIPSVFDTI